MQSIRHENRNRRNKFASICVAAIVVAATAMATPSGTAASSDRTSPLAPRFFGWGANNRGQVGDGTNQTRPIPTSLALPSGEQAANIAAGPRFGLLLTASGKVYAWGDNRHGELGIGTVTSGSWSPVPVAMPPGTTVTSISAGPGHATAVTNDGLLYAWGENSFGELGIGSFTAFEPLPQRVVLPAGTLALAAAAGEQYTLALTSNGRVLSWGLNSHGEFGNGTTSVTAVTAVPIWVTIAPSDFIIAIGAGDHSQALTSDGRVLSWGANGYGQLGIGTVNRAGSPYPVLVTLPGGVVVTAISDNAGHTSALTATGQILTWGINDHGQLGDGTVSAFSAVPVCVVLPPSSLATSLATGGGNGFAVLNTGSVVAWGRNTNGSLGDGSMIDRPTPVFVNLATQGGVARVEAGGQHVIALSR